MNRIKGVFGFLLLGTALWMVPRVMTFFVAPALWGALFLGEALTLHQMLRGRCVQCGWLRASALLVRSTALVVGLWGVAMVLGAAAGGTDPWRPLARMASGFGSASQDKDTAPTNGAQSAGITGSS